MNKKIFGVCDIDKTYAENLTHYLSKKIGDRFGIMAFSSSESLRDFVKSGGFEILLVSESFINECGNFVEDFTGVIPENTYVLAEEKGDGEYTYQTIYKYQSAENVLRIIISDYDKSHSFSRKNTGTVKITGVYSPIKRCGKTGMALAIATHLAKSDSTVFVSLEDYCSMELLKKDSIYAGISDYIFRSAVEDASSLYDDMILKNYGGADIILSANCPEDIRTADTLVIKNIIDSLLDAGRYRSIVIDIGDAVSNQEMLLSMCDNIFVPYLDDEASRFKLGEWEGYMRQTGYADVLDKCVKYSAQESEADSAEYARLLLKRRTAK